MKTLTIEISELSFAALDTVADDPTEWVRNAVEARASAAIGEQKTKPAWMQAAMAVMSQGGDPMNDEAVFLVGFELGLFATPLETDLDRVG